MVTNGRRRAALARRSRYAKARNTIRRFARSIGRTRPNPLLRMGPFGNGRLRARPYFRRRNQRSIDQGTCTLKRQTYSTAIYNTSTVDDLARWVNADGIVTTNMPLYWNLWDQSGVQYVAPNTAVICPTEIGANTAGGAGAIIRGRIRVCHNDVMLPDELKNWEYIRLDYVTFAMTYMRTEYMGGNDASGISPVLEYFTDTDGSFTLGGSPEQDTVVELNRRPNMRRIKLTPNKTSYFKVVPKAFQIIAPDPQQAWTVGRQVPVGFIDPNSNASFVAPFSNLQFQIRNAQLPGTQDGNQVSFFKLIATYHYTCKRFIGTTVN